MQEAEEYVERKFKQYYEKNAQRIRPPPKIENREFGFLLFREGVMIRHKAFKTIADLHSFVRTTTPAHVYNSTAYYVDPDKEMDKKGWQGADLAFDVDADHIATACKYIHDKWTCKSCGTQGKGPCPDTCPKCRGERMDEEVWLCEICLERAREEVIKLMDFLTEDFGFSRREMTVCFSGHRGYHVHLRNDEAKDLGSDERKEIVDYIMGLGFDSNSYSGLLDERLTLGEYSQEHRGWLGRIRRGAYEILTETSENELVNWGINRRIAKAIASRRDELASAWIGEAKSRRLEGVGPTTWKTIAQKAMERESAKVDTVVTTDIHRLIRLPETLNAKTGLKAVEVNIESFDPFKDAIAFEGEETVYATDAPQFRIGNQTFGPYTNQTVTVPTAAATLLIAKGKAVSKRE